jgi:hypothetical protein
LAKLPVLPLTKRDDLSRRFEQKRVFAASGNLNDVDGA